jgi:hypothetical protein
MKNNRKPTRRHFLTGSLLTVSSVLAGCSLGGNNEDQNTPTLRPPEDSGYEENESDAEKEFERTPNGFFDGWVEFENPTEQIPRDNYTLTEYPSLQVLEGCATSCGLTENVPTVSPAEDPTSTPTDEQTSTPVPTEENTSTPTEESTGTFSPTGGTANPTSPITETTTPTPTEEAPVTPTVNKDSLGAYSPDVEALYLGWTETDEGKLVLGVWYVLEYTTGNGIESGRYGENTSRKYTDQSADVAGILQNVVEGFDDISPDMDEEYADILGV